MIKKRLAFVVRKADQRQRLDLFLAAHTAERHSVDLSRRRARRLIEQGAVYVDRKRVRVASRPLRAGMAVEIVWPEEEVEASRPPQILTSENILYEDEDLIAVDKPSGLPTQATRTDARHHLLAYVERFLTERDGRPPYLRLHHRLDRGTSGVVLLARSARANGPLAEAFRERQMEKVYRALCVGRAEESVLLGRGTFTVENRLAMKKEGRSRRVQVSMDGRLAVSHFRILEWKGENAPNSPGIAAIEARPRTGRTHQLRVHLADAGWPVIGDRLYGADGIAQRRLRLHAHRLSMPHPIYGGVLAIESPIPKDLEIRSVEL